MGVVKVEVLHIDACPNWQGVGRVLMELVDELGIAADAPTFTLIRSPEDAARHPFAGSPTVLIDGIDAVPGAELTTELACRIYRDGAKSGGMPTKESLRAALLRRSESAV
jgi:hypothetical protein